MSMLVWLSSSTIALTCIILLINKKASLPIFAKSYVSIVTRKQRQSLLLCGPVANQWPVSKLVWKSDVQGCRAPESGIWWRSVITGMYKTGFSLVGMRHQQTLYIHRHLYCSHFKLDSHSLYLTHKNVEDVTFVNHLSCPSVAWTNLLKIRLPEPIWSTATAFQPPLDISGCFQPRFYIYLANTDSWRNACFVVSRLKGKENNC